MDMNMRTFEELQRHQLVTEFNVQSQSELVDYQVKLENVDNPTQAQDNLVVGSDGGAFSHWNESVDFDIWVKMGITTSGKRVLLIHGNSGLNSQSSGNDTFIQYHGSETSQFVDTLLSDLISNVIFEAKVRATAATHNMNWGLASVAANEGGDRVSIKTYSPDTDIYAYCEDGVSAKTLLQFNTYSFTQNQWYKLKITNDGTTIHFYFDSTEIESGSTTTLPNNNMGLQFHIQTGTGEQEWSFARKYTEVEPTVKIGTPKNISTALKSFGRAG